MGEDIIFIDSLTASTILGVHEEERIAPRQVVVSVRLRTDIRKAARSDAIEDCIDYSRLAAGIRALLDGARFFTVEALAEEIARHCLSIVGVGSVYVRLEKPGAVEGTGSVGVEIERP